MDYQVLKDKILSGPAAAECAPYVLTPESPKTSGAEARVKDQAIADILNAQDPITQIVSRPFGIGTVLDTLGPTAGATVLNTLESIKGSVPALKWAWLLLERGELDIGMASTRAQVQALVGTAFTQPQADAILALAERQVPVSGADVSIALRGDF